MIPEVECTSVVSWSIDPARSSSVCSQCLSLLSLSLSLARALLQLLMRVLYCISFILLHTQVLFNMQRLSSLLAQTGSQFRAGYTQLRTCAQQWLTFLGGILCTFCVCWRDHVRDVTSRDRLIGDLQDGGGVDRDDGCEVRSGVNNARLFSRCWRLWKWSLSSAQ